MEQELLTLLKEKNERDYQEIVEEFEKLSKTQIMNNAYEMAHYNEVTDFLDNVAYDADWCNLDEEDVKTIIDYDKNFIKKVFNNWLNYNHPERFNFFCYEDLIDIIHDTIYSIN